MASFLSRAPARVSVPESPPSLSGENGLVVHVVEARGLMNKDMFGGKSNPFVVLKLWDQEFVSHVVKNSLSPRWNQTFVFTVDGFAKKRELNDLYSEELTVTLWDKDNLFKNGFLGMVKISIASLVDNQVRDLWYPLEKRSSKSRVKGNIRLWTHLTIPPPLTSNGVTFYPHSASSFTSHRISATLDGASLTPDSLFSKNKDVPTFAMTFTHTPHSSDTVTPSPSPPKLGNFIDEGDFLHISSQSPDGGGDKGKGKGKENPTLSFLLSLPPSSPPPSSPYVDGFGELVEDEDMIAILRLEEDEKRKKDEEEERLFREYLSSLQRCSVCGEDDDGDPLVLSCDHTFCRNCLAENIRKMMKGQKHHKGVEGVFAVGCPTCESVVGEWAIKRALPQAEYDAILNQSLQSFIDSGKDIFRCPHGPCRAPIERVPHTQQQNKQQGGSLVLQQQKIDATAIAEQHREEFRFRCRSCTTEFCAGCMIIPYHAGYTCEGYARYLKSKHCRFCAETLPAPSAADASSSSGSSGDVCKSEECAEKAKLSCKRYNPCGHPCGGILDETHCLPCLQCDGASSSTEQTADDFCNICWVESLGSAPSIRLKCGHIFHYVCIKSKLKKRWPAARITFGFSECPLCKDSIDHPALDEELKPIRDLKAIVQQKALQRLEFEGLSKAKELVEASSKWHNNREGFAMDKYAYFMCAKCAHPYFAGQRRCDAGEDDKPFDPADLVCGGCSGSVLAAECPTHGKDFLEWKCQFCCTVSSWYCWGKTHFCNDCHTRQQKGDYLTKKPKSAITMCPGPDKCPLGIAHPHCEEFLLGCALCRNVRSF